MLFEKIKLSCRNTYTLRNITGEAKTVYFIYEKIQNNYCVEKNLIERVKCDKKVTFYLAHLDTMLGKHSHVALYI